MTNPLSAEGRKPVERIDVASRCANGGTDRRSKLGRHDLVGIQRKHPVARHRCERAILLRTEAGPVGGNDDARTVRPGDRDDVVGAAAVDDDDVVRERERFQALREAARGIVGNDGDAERRFSHEGSCG